MADPGPADYLSTLPPTVQAAIVDIVKVAADTSADEKALILSWLDQGALGLLTNVRTRDHARCAELLAHLGLILSAIHYAANPQEAPNDHTP